MRILVVTPYFYPHPGGSQRYIEELYGAVMAQDPSIEVDVLTYNTEEVEKRESYKGISIYRVGCIELLRGQFALPNYFEVIQLARKIKQNEYDVVNAHTRFFDTSWWGWLLAKYLGARSILTDHCAYHPQHQNGLVRSVAKLVDALAIPVLGMVYDQVVAVSQATKRFLEDRGMTGIEVVYGGVDTNLYAVRKGIRELKGVGLVGDDAIVITFLGRMIPSKGPDLVIEAAESLLTEYDNVLFVMAGDGSMLPEFEKHKLDGLVFLGTIDRNEVVDLLSITDVVVSPSTHHEGLPSVVLEAGAAGCAVVTTDRGGVTEMIVDGESGLLVEPTAASVEKGLRKLVVNSKMRRELGRSLKKKISSNFDWSVIARSYSRTLRKLI